MFNRFGLLLKMLHYRAAHADNYARIRAQIPQVKNFSSPIVFVILFLNFWQNFQKQAYGTGIP